MSARIILPAFVLILSCATVPDLWCQQPCQQPRQQPCKPQKAIHSLRDIARERSVTAKQNLPKALAKVKAMEAAQDPNLGSALHGLADVYAKMGLDQKLFAAEQQALKSDAKAFGPESYQVAVDWNDLGVAYDRADRNSDAAHSYQRCLQLLKKLPGRHEDQEFTVYLNLGYLYLWAPRTAKSESAFSHALKIAKRDSNIPSTTIAEIRSELVKLNRVDQAEQAEEQARVDRAPGPANVDSSPTF